MLGTYAWVFNILLLGVLIAVNAFFASSEIAVISLNDNKIKKMAEEGNKKAIMLNRLISEPTKFLSTIQIGVTLSGLLASAVAAESFSDHITAFVISTGFPIDQSVLKLVSVLVITLLLSFFTLVLGELVPKRLAMQNAEKISMVVVSPLSFLSVVTSPFIKLLTVSTNFTIRLMGGDPNAENKTITEEEIRMMVDVGQENGAIQDAEKEMINNIFEFNDTVISEIMTHRTEVVAISIDASFEEVMKIAVEEKYSRIPVYEENIDNIVGVLFTKDLLPLKAVSAENFDIQKLFRKPYFVPQSKKTNELFKDLQKNKVHMAIAIDEYGGTAGIITMEDLIEEVFGNILDEYDEDEKEIEKVDDLTYMISGTVSVEKVQNIFNVELPSDEYETIGGFIMGQLGRITETGEKPEVEYNGLLLKVEEVDDKRISKVKICKV